MPAKQPPRSSSRSGSRWRFAVVMVLYCFGCWALVLWGGLEAVGYQRPYPWIGAVLLELPVSLVLIAAHVLLSVSTVGETLGTVMGFVLFFGLVAAPVCNIIVVRGLVRRVRGR